MSGTEPATRQDDFARIIRFLADAPAGGLSIDEIQKLTEAGEKWSYRTINELLCGLGGKVRFEKVRVRQMKVTKYTLRSN